MKNRKSLAFLLSAAMLASVTAFPAAAAEVTGTGTAQGIDGPITVEVTVDGDKITKVEITEQNETQGIGSVAVEQFPDEIVKTQNIDIDNISGATVTSTGIKDAVKAALEDAGVDPAAFEERKALRRRLPKHRRRMKPMRLMSLSSEPAVQA